MTNKRREWFKKLRKENGYTQETLAQKIEVTRQHISGIERGSSVGVEKAQMLGKELGFNWARFYEEEREVV